MDDNFVLYQYRDFAIVLPTDHGLPVYQATHPRYDRFLPHLARYLEAGTTVVDVGANCGDTLAAMYSENPALQYVCIEPDGLFFDLLNVNAARIRARDPQAAITTLQAMVGKDVSGATLEGDKGTKKAVFGKAGTGVASRSLDDLLASVPHARPRLLKSDVDGFDYDVLHSAEATLHASHPLLFFECQLDHAYQKTAYEAVLARLEFQGYRDWVAFDNYGEMLLRTRDVRLLVQLFDYVWRQNLRRSTRTMYYLDLLACTDADGALVGRVMADYVASSWQPDSAGRQPSTPIGVQGHD